MHDLESAPLTLGTAGHIDHGKTVLVEALTGVNTDRLPQEKERGISIELGFALLELPSGRSMSIVDVPGHERFVRTMVAGATGIDLFLLVIAADDGVMPQTREHLAVLEALDVPAGVVAITKTDIAGYDTVRLAVEEARELLAGTRYERSAIVPVSAPTREGLDQLLGALDAVASRSQIRAGRAEARLRLHVDRVFTLKGIGTVVTGTLWSGTVGVGDELRIEPSRRMARVRSIEVHGRERQRAEAGQRVAVSLAGIARNEIERGDVLTAPNSALRPTYLVDAAVELVPGARPLGRGTRLHLHHGTRTTAARLAPIEGDVLEPAKRSYVQLRLERPIVPAEGDRFVLRQVAPADTIGGGTVLDATPKKHGAAPEHVERLELLESDDPLRTLEAQLERSASGLAESEADAELLEELRQAGRACLAGTGQRRYFTPRQLELARKRVAASLGELGGARPASRGALANAAGISAEGAQSVLEELIAEGLVIARGPGFYLAESAAAQAAGVERVGELLRADFLEPRSAEALANELGMSRYETDSLLERAVAEGRLIRLKPGLYYHPDALAEAERRVFSLCERAGWVTIASLRDELGTSRKYAQALLEHFDASRLTRREGDVHVLRRGISLRARPSRSPR